MNLGYTTTLFSFFQYKDSQLDCIFIADIRGLLDPLVLAADLLAGLRSGGAHSLPARSHPDRANRINGQRLLYGGSRDRTIPRRLLPFPTKTVSE